MFDIFKGKKDADIRLISTTQLAKKYNISSKELFIYLEKKSYIVYKDRSWTLTSKGKKIGGDYKESKQYGKYIVWPENLELKDLSSKKATDIKSDSKSSDFRDKFEAKYRCTDGHFVRSKAEMLIDNWLYMAEIVHAYEKKLPIQEELYSDFYIPTGKVYIEYWGYENDKKYLKRKQIKQKLYKKYRFNLIELNESDVQNLDDVLPKMLLKFGIKTY